MPSSEEKNNDQITEVKETRADRKPQADPALAIDPERLARMHENKKRFHRKRRIKDWAMFTGYLTPSLVGVMVFFFLPLLLILKTSFQRSSTNTDFVGIENYERVLTNEAFINSAKNSLTFSGIAVPLSVVLALLLAILLNTKLPGESVFRSVLLNPMMVPVASVVLIWQVFFSYNGMANGWGLYKLFEDGRIDWLKSDHSQLVILALFLWKNLGYNMVLFLAALNSIDQEILEAATMDGAGSITRFFRIKMHFLAPTLFFVAIMSLINSFKIFREVYLLTLDYSKLSAGAIIMCVFMIVIVGALFFAESKFDADMEG